MTICAITLKTPRYDPMTETAADMLTDDEIMKIIDACVTARDKAFSRYWRIAARGLRGRALRWRDLSFDDDGGVECTITTARRARSG